MKSGIKHVIPMLYNREETAELILDSVDRLQRAIGGGKVVVSFSKHDERRSTEQNKYLWEMFGQVASEMTRITNGQYAYTKEDAHDLLLQSLRGVSKRMIGKTEVITQIKTSEMSQAEAAEFISECLAWCMQKGINVMMPAEWSEWARQVR